MDFGTVIEMIVAPALTAAVGWVAGNRKRKNDFLKDMQESINLLADENKKLMSEVVELRRENAALRTEVGELKRQLENVGINTKKE